MLKAEDISHFYGKVGKPPVNQESRTTVMSRKESRPSNQYSVKRFEDGTQLSRSNGCVILGMQHA